MTHRGNRGAAALLAAALALAGCGGPGPRPAGLPPDPDPAPAPIAHHVAVIDAGSSGSRLFLYRSQPHGGFVRVEAVYSTRAAPHPLAWYDGTHGPGSEPARAGPDGLEPLLRGLRQALRERGLEAARTPVHALATAGMRLLPDAPARQIHASVRAAIEAQGFPAGEVATLSGQREGLYSWADANYLLGRFQTGADPVGIVEVGGASAQVAFAAGPGAPPAAVLPVRVHGRDHAVFSVSYLGLGQAQALQALLRGAEGAAGACHPAGAPATPAAPPGRYAFGACDQAYARQVLWPAGASAPVPLPAVRQVPGFAGTPFVGVSAVRHAFGDWGLAAAQGLPPDAALRQALQHHCPGNGAWARLQAGYANAAYRAQACAHGTFLHALLFGADGLGLAGGQLLWPIGPLAGQNLQWTRGLVVLLQGAQAQAAQ